MEHILIKSESAENYGSMDMSPECKPRPLNDNHTFGEYVIIAKTIFLGPHWPLFAGTLIGFNIFAYIMMRQQITQGHDITFGIIITIVQSIFYLGVGLANPGIANDSTLNYQYQGQLYSLPNKPQQRNVWYCEKCQKIQPARSDHCPFCRVCITNYDHHCPWTGKCIGGENLLHFWAFLISTIIFFSYFITILLNQREEAQKQ
ncbi:unnamed protein product [Paramecium pentaurelia]|uniref:Palmitoyltransferase n=1 Tax=Paramecium pentaurelia TaxID=43138 RepID=A0A8S1WPY1_9CILI|nr:unnamed protein product [Paramecium pentaurelia]